MRNFAIKAKKTIKKVAAMSVGAAMVGSTLFGAAAATDLADYPNPFVEDGMWNTVLVVGADSAAADVAGAIDISAKLSQQATTGYTGSTTVSAVENGVSLASGSDKVYFAAQLDAQRDILTDTDLPNILADGQFVDGDGTEYDYTQTIDIGDTTTTFSDSGNDLTEPLPHVNVGDSSGSPLYTMVLTFDSAVNFTESAVHGESITLFGKDFTVGSSSDSNYIQLLGGSMDVSLDWGETKTVTFEGTEYEISLNGVQQTNSVATLTVNGDTDTVAQGATKKVGGVDVYADTVNYYGLDAYPGDAVISLGAEELWLQTGQAVMTGSGKDDIDGTVATITDSTTHEDVTKIEIAVAAENGDTDHILAGEAFTDTVFGNFKVDFLEWVNGVEIASDYTDANSARYPVEIGFASDDSLNVQLEVQGDTETIEWVNDHDLACDDEDTADSCDITVVSGARSTFTEDEYFFLVSGNSRHFVQATHVSCTTGDDDKDDLKLKDVFSGQTFEFSNQEAGSAVYTWNGVDGYTYYVECTTADTYRITSSNDEDSDFTIEDGETVQVFPYLEPIADSDFRFAFTDSVAILDEFNTTINSTPDVTVKLPTGYFCINTNGTDASNATDIYVNSACSGTPDYADVDSATSIQVGEVYYVITPTAGTGSNCLDISLGVETEQTGSGSVETSPGILFREASDNSASDAYHAVIIPSVYDGSQYTDIESTNIKMTSASEDANNVFDDSHFQGWIDPFGVYLMEDSSDSTHGDLAYFSYPAQQTYANIWVAPTEAASTTTTTSGDGVTVHSVSGVDVAKLDTEISDKTAKPLLLVGGPAVNRLTAEVAGLSYPTYGAGSQDEFGYSEGKAAVKLYESAFGGDHVAIVVAGWEADDTRRACKVLKDYSSYDLSGDHIVVTGTQTTPVVEPYVEETTEETTTEETTEETTE